MMKTIKESLSFFKKRWYTLTLLQFISALILASFTWLIVARIKKLMEVVTQSQGNLLLNLETLGENVEDLAAFTNGDQTLQVISNAVNEIILLSIVLVIGIFLIYSITEGFVWKKVLETKKKFYPLGFFLATLPLFLLIIAIAVFEVINWYLALGAFLFISGWTLSSYARL